MFIGFEQKTVSNVVLTASDFTIPANATFVVIQTTGEDVRYTMDDSTNPTATLGMFFHSEHAGPPAGTASPEPYFFLIEDFLRIRMIRGAASDAVINLHYGVGRDV
jgi:hypothetical protein